jgi:hypothetical protein
MDTKPATVEPPSDGEALEPEFWKRRPLAQLTAAEWEALCDGCGLCCLQKLSMPGGAVFYTGTPCRLLDTGTGRCGNYAERKRIVPSCERLTPAKVTAFHWLPATCAYRLVDAGKDLPEWHHLVCGDREAVHRAGVSVRYRAVGAATHATTRRRRRHSAAE